MRTSIALVAFTVVLGSCNHGARLIAGGGQDRDPAGTPALIAAEPAPRASRRLALRPDETAFAGAIESYFQDRTLRHLYIQTDKPLYKPGESIWVKTWDLRVRDHGSGADGAVTLELVNPRGGVIERKQVPQHAGTATGDLTLSEDAEGGEYQLRFTGADGQSDVRAVVVSRYEAPRLKKTLEFLRKAYGPGDQVQAAVTIKRPTGEPLGGARLAGVVALDGRALPDVAVTTDAQGGALVAFTLPPQIERGDGLLTVMVEDGGVTESIGKSIPIVLE